jgi:hypothetical protein
MHAWPIWVFLWLLSQPLSFTGKHCPWPGQPGACDAHVKGAEALCIQRVCRLHAASCCTYDPAGLHCCQLFLLVMCEKGGIVMTTGLSPTCIALWQGFIYISEHAAEPLAASHSSCVAAGLGVSAPGSCRAVQACASAPPPNCQTLQHCSQPSSTHARWRQVSMNTDQKQRASSTPQGARTQSLYVCSDTPSRDVQTTCVHIHYLGQAAQAAS